MSIHMFMVKTVRMPMHMFTHTPACTSASFGELEHMANPELQMKRSLASPSIRSARNILMNVPSPVEDPEVHVPVFARGPYTYTCMDL